MSRLRLFDGAAGFRMGRLAILCFAALLAGCATVNQEKKGPPAPEYSLPKGRRGSNSNSLFVVLSFSGGGNRASALAYSVLKALHGITIELEAGKPKSLLDEVDVISTVSGGSVTGAYYALYGNEIFTNPKLSFERRFLDKNLTGDLVMGSLFPLISLALLSPWYDRIHFTAQQFDTLLLGGKTYADLIGPMRKQGRPFLIVNATDLFAGARFEFTQEYFDVINSSLSTYPLAKAVAASAAFPGLLSPMTLWNYSPAKTTVSLGELEDYLYSYNSKHSRMAYFEAHQLKRYAAGEASYIHLVDGGVSDNIGARALHSLYMGRRRGNSIASQLQDSQEPVKHVLFIMVNARGNLSQGWPTPFGRAPWSGTVLKRSASIGMDEYSTDSAQLIEDIASGNEKDSAAGSPGKNLKVHVVEVAFEALSGDADAKDREEAGGIPTWFHLSKKHRELIARLGPKILCRSNGFKDALGQIAADSGREVSWESVCPDGLGTTGKVRVP